MEESPRWYVKVRLPISLDDPRGIFEIPAAFFETPTSGNVVEVIVEPDDPAIEAAGEVLYAASKHAPAAIFEFTFCGHRMKLNPHMREDLLAAVTALIAGVSLECKVETEPCAALN